MRDNHGARMWEGLWIDNNFENHKAVLLIQASALIMVVHRKICTYTYRNRNGIDERTEMGSILADLEKPYVQEYLSINMFEIFSCIKI